jgi:heme A synthase
MWGDPSGEFVRVLFAGFLLLASPVLSGTIGAIVGVSRGRPFRGAFWGALGTLVALAAFFFISMVLWQAPDNRPPVKPRADVHRDSNEMFLVFAGGMVAGALSATVAVRLAGDPRRKAKRWSSPSSRDDITKDLSHSDGGPMDILL